MLTRARTHPVLALAAVIAAVLLANGAVESFRDSRERIDACSLLPASVVRAVLGADAAGEPFEPEGGDKEATGCRFGEGAGDSIIVFAQPDSATDFVRAKTVSEQKGASFDEVDGDGYQAYWGPGPNVGGAPKAQALSLLKEGHRIQVIVYGATDESIRPLVLAAVAEAL
jgi:hypothetical protein